MKLWDKGISIDKKIEKFTVGNDRELDMFLAEYDLTASKAHAKMLGKVGILDSGEVDDILKELEKLPLFERQTISLQNSLQESSSGIIAEFKRCSPSKPEINLTASIEDVLSGYQGAGAAGVSVLTDTEFFGGSLEDLNNARKVLQLPVLRKDFIIDEYQILEAKGNGADVILLIAAVLSPQEIKSLSETAKKLNMEVLLEVHNEEELQKSLMQSLDLIGVNNRNLKTFNTDIGRSKDLSGLIPKEFLKISESGIQDPETVKELRRYGFQGFLIGENFMRSENPGKSAETFIKNLER
jgi:indole-3-glycerol phosphate synthase